MKSKMKYIKSGLILFIIIFMILMLRADPESEKDVTEIEQTISSSINSDKMKAASAKELLRNIGLTADDYDGFLYYAPVSTMDADELLIIKLVSPDQADVVEEAVYKRIETQLTDFQGYGAEQCQLLNDAIVKTYGNYVFYAVSADASKIRDNFADNLY